MEFMAASQELCKIEKEKILKGLKNEMELKDNMTSGE